MEAYEIDGLLKQVSPELLAGYEKKNLSGEALAVVNQEYKSAVRMHVKFDYWVDRISMYAGFGMWIGMLTFFTGNAKISISVMFGSVFLMSFVIYGIVTKRDRKCREIRTRCESILANFRQSVKGLDPTWCSPNDRYNETSVRETLVGFAFKLLDAESKFKKERMLEDAATYSVLHYGNWEVKCRDELENRLRAVEKFGMTFNKADLFKDARKHL